MSENYFIRIMGEQMKTRILCYHQILLGDTVIRISMMKYPMLGYNAAIFAHPDRPLLHHHCMFYIHLPRTKQYNIDRRNSCHTLTQPGMQLLIISILKLRPLLKWSISFHSLEGDPWWLFPCDYRWRLFRWRHRH